MNRVGPIVFWPHRTHSGVASTRIRVLQVVQGLQALGVDSRICGEAPADPPSVLVLGKRYDPASLAQAQAFQAQGCRVVLDLCDNHFYDRRMPEGSPRARQLMAACRQVDRVVASTPALAEAILAACGPEVSLRVVPDGLDGGGGTVVRARWSDTVHALRLRAFDLMHRTSPGRRLVWFGQHGVPYAEAGLRDLARVEAALHQHHREQPLQLVVVSNRWATYRELAARWSWPSLYLPWSPTTFEQALAHADIALIPAQLNPFTVCKTNNRPASAFMRGLAVAADAVPSYLPLAPWLVLDDWHAGLGRLMANGEDRARRIAGACTQLTTEHHPERIARRWAEVLAELAPLPALTPP